MPIATSLQICVTYFSSQVVTENSSLERNAPVSGCPPHSISCHVFLDAFGTLNLRLKSARRCCLSSTSLYIEIYDGGIAICHHQMNTAFPSLQLDPNHESPLAFPTPPRQNERRKKHKEPKMQQALICPSRECRRTGPGKGGNSFEIHTRETHCTRTHARG